MSDDNGYTKCANWFVKRWRFKTDKVDVKLKARVFWYNNSLKDVIFARCSRVSSIILFCFRHVEFFI